MSRYLLPCHNGRTLEISTADAGRMMKCPCGKQVQVPTLREVRQLPPAGEVGAVSGIGGGRPAAKWSTQQGAVFVAGVIVLVAGLGWLGWLVYQRTQLETQPPEIDPQEAIDQIASRSPARTIDDWNDARNLGPMIYRRTPRYLVHREMAKALYLRMGVAGGFMLAGVGLVIVSLWMKPPSRKRRRPQGPKPKGAAKQDAVKKGDG